MKLSSLTVPSLLLEMAAKKVCPVCGHGMVNYHFYYKGGFKCKSTSLAAPDVAAAKQSAADLIAAGYPATLDGLKAQTQGLAPGSTPVTAPTRPKTTSTKVAAPTAVPTQPTVAYSGIQEKIANWLRQNKITNFTINDDNSVDVDGDLNLDGLRHAKLPVNFKSVTGSVSLVGALLKTLEGLPDEINGDFDISSMDLDSVEGFPMKVHGDCHIGKTNVKTTLANSRLAHVEGDLLIHEYGSNSFVGLPAYVGGDFIVKDCPEVTSLKGMPKEIGGDCRMPARQIKSLNGMTQKIGGKLEIKSPGFVGDITGIGEVGGSIHLTVRGDAFNFSKLPRHIKGDLSISTNSTLVSSLEGFPERVDGDINVDMSGLTNPGKYNKFIKQMNGTLRIGSIVTPYDYSDATKSYALIGKNLLSIPMIKGIKELYIQKQGSGGANPGAVAKINTMINRCIQGDIDIHELQEQLIDAGFSQIARL